jgi:hypothetical protein
MCSKAKAAAKSKSKKGYTKGNVVSNNYVRMDLRRKKLRFAGTGRQKTYKNKTKVSKVGSARGRAGLCSQGGITTAVCDAMRCSWFCSSACSG